MTLVREPGSEILAQFTVPTRGTWRNTAINTVPLDAVYNSLNIFVREGKLRRRPALNYTAQNALPFTGGDVAANFQIIGGLYVIVTSSGLRLHVAASATHLFIGAADNTWTKAAADFANGLGDTIDTALIESSSETNVIFANTARVLKKWKSGDATATTVTGTNIPSAKSICISASRVVALISPHTVVWSRVLDFTNFDALAIVRRAQTADEGICVRSLSALSFILYKETSIHPARAQAGLDEGSAFAFSEPINVEGPAGIFAVVDVNGIHMYMTKSGRIALFDGTNYPQWIADGIWFYLQGDINQSTAYLIRGVYDYRLNVVIFYYPRVSPNTMTGMVVVNLPFPGFEAQEGLIPYCFLGISTREVRHTYPKRELNSVSRANVFTTFVTGGDKQSCNLHEDNTLDPDASFTCSFQTGLQSAPDARHIQTTSESFLERNFGYGTVSVAPVTSNSLETPGGTIHTADAQTIDLEATPVNEYIGFNKKTRFFGFNYTWSSSSEVRYSGTVVYDSIFRKK